MIKIMIPQQYHPKPNASYPSVDLPLNKLWWNQVFSNRYSKKNTESRHPVMEQSHKILQLIDPVTENIVYCHIYNVSLSPIPSKRPSDFFANFPFSKESSNERCISIQVKVLPAHEPYFKVLANSPNEKEFLTHFINMTFDLKEILPLFKSRVNHLIFKWVQDHIFCPKKSKSFTNILKQINSYG